MARIRDQAICLRHLDWSETSQVVVLLTEQHGKLRGLAKGSKRLSPSSIARFCGGIELLTGGEVVAVIRPSSELATITEWDLQEPYRRLRTHLAVQRLACYAADLCHAMLADGDAHPQSFAALRDLLDAIGREPNTSASTEPAREQTALLDFQWRLLSDCGYRPRLNRDARSSDDLPDRAMYAFDPRAGGFTAESDALAAASSRMSNTGPWKVRRETLQVLRALEQSTKPPATSEALLRANRLLCVYARALLDRELPTATFVLNHEH